MPSKLFYFPQYIQSLLGVWSLRCLAVTSVKALLVISTRIRKVLEISRGFLVNRALHKITIFYLS